MTPPHITRLGLPHAALPRQACEPVVFFLPIASARADPPLHERIDSLIERRHADNALHAAPPATDAEFLRRATLDLNGTVPSANEVRAFIADGSADRRESLIDRLLAQPAYANRLAQFFDVALMERRPDAKVARAAWEDFLRGSFARNKPYDQVVREILSADGTDPKNRGPAKFYLDRKLEPTVLARDIGRLFLGRDLRCAQCHDHPLVEDFKQEQFYGLLAFLNRSYLFPNGDAATAVIAEKADGEVTFASVFDKAKKQHSTGPRLPSRAALSEPKVEKGKEYKVKPAANVRPVPTFSRREQLAAAITDPQNRAFARTAVNRLWSLMFGRGLVEPLDMDHSGNPPSHPELLELVDRRIHGPSLRREVAASRIGPDRAPISGSSEVPPGQADPMPEQYVSAALKPLAPEEFAAALLQATGQTDAERLALGKNSTAAAVERQAGPAICGDSLGLRRTAGGARRPVGGDLESGAVLEVRRADSRCDRRSARQPLGPSKQNPRRGRGGGRVVCQRARTVADK